MNILRNKDLKINFIGISLSNLSTVESAAAVIDANSNILLLEKLFTMQDVKYFLDNTAGIKNSIILVSIPENEVMLNSKWKYNSRTYDIVNIDNKMHNYDGWTNRFSTRGCEYFKELYEKGTDIYRFDVDNMRKVLGNCCAYRERTPIDCKALQDALRINYNFGELPSNMLPVAQLEALLGAVSAKMIVYKHKDFECKIIGTYSSVPIISIENAN